MSDIAEFVQSGAAKVAPKTLEELMRELPLWKSEFAQIHTPRFPHLVRQLEFLADLVEDVYDGAYKELPYAALAAAVFALLYAKQEADLIPDWTGEMGRADDSSVVRAVLILHEKALMRYAEWRRIPWNRISTKP